MKRKMKEYDELKQELRKKLMWAVIKFDKKKFSLLKNDLSKKLGNDLKLYVPKYPSKNL